MLDSHTTNVKCGCCNRTSTPALLLEWLKTSNTDLTKHEEAVKHRGSVYSAVGHQWCGGHHCVVLHGAYCHVERPRSSGGFHPLTSPALSTESSPSSLGRSSQQCRNAAKWAAKLHWNVVVVVVYYRLRMWVCCYLQVSSDDSSITRCIKKSNKRVRRS